MSEWISESLASLPEKLIENVNRKAGDISEKWTGDGYIDRELDSIEAVQSLEIFGWDTGLYEDISPGSGPNGEIMLWDCDRYPESPACGGGWNPERMIDFIGRLNVIETRCFKCISWTYYLAGLALPPVSFCAKKPECQKDQELEDEHREGQSEEQDERGEFPPGDPNDLMMVVECRLTNRFEQKLTATGGGMADCRPGLLWHYKLESGIERLSFDKKYRLISHRWKERESWDYGTGGIQESRPNEFNQLIIEQEENRRYRKYTRFYSNSDFPDQEPYINYYYQGLFYENAFGFLNQFDLGLNFFEFYRRLENGSFEKVQNVLRTNVIATEEPTGKSDLNVYFGKRGDIAAYFELEGGLLLSKREYSSEFVPSPENLGYPYACDYVQEITITERYRYNFYTIDPKKIEEDTPPPGNMDKDCCNSDGIQALTRLVRKIHKYVGCTDDELENALLSKRLNTVGEVEGHETPRNIPQVLEFLIRQIDRAVGFLPVQIEIAKTTGVDAEGNAQEEELSVEFHTISDALKQLFELNRDMAKAQIQSQTNIAQPEQDKIENEVTITRLCLASLYELATIHKLVVIAQNDVNLLKEYFNPDYRDRSVPIPFAFDLSAGQLGFGEGLDQLPPERSKQTLEYFKRLLQPGRQRIVLSQLNPKEITLDERLQEIAKNCATAAAALSQKVGSESQAKALIEAAQFALKMGRFLNQDDTEQVLKRMGQGAADLSEFESSVERGYPEERTEATPYGLPEQEAPRVYRRTRRRSSAGGN